MSKRTDIDIDRPGIEKGSKTSNKQQQHPPPHQVLDHNSSKPSYPHISTGFDMAFQQPPYKFERLDKDKASR